jgi:DNA-binding transcriptional regulator YdaS (Cro superfamily)
MNHKSTPSKQKTPIDRAIECAGSMKALADALGVTKAAVFQWKFPGRRVPAQHCPAIERLTLGAVRCEELRPDVDWAYLRGEAAASGAA